MERIYNGNLTRIVNHQAKQQVYILRTIDQRTLQLFVGLYQNYQANEQP